MTDYDRRIEKLIDELIGACRRVVAFDECVEECATAEAACRVFMRCVDQGQDIGPLLDWVESEARSRQMRVFVAERHRSTPTLQ